MTQLKTQVYTDAKLDLSLYIESLLEVNEPAQLVDNFTSAAEIDADTLTKQHFSLPKEFDCLQVTIGELPFLIPTSHIGKVLKINQSITRLPVEGNAFLGLVNFKGHSMAVIDLITLVREQKGTKTSVDMQVRDNFIQHILVMRQGRYALALDKPGALCTLAPADIHISNAKHVHRLYHGIAKSQLCPVINIDAVDRVIARMPFIQSL